MVKLVTLSESSLSTINLACTKTALRNFSRNFEIFGGGQPFLLKKMHFASNFICKKQRTLGYIFLQKSRHFASHFYVQTKMHFALYTYRVSQLSKLYPTYYSGHLTIAQCQYLPASQHSTLSMVEPCGNPSQHVGLINVLIRWILRSTETGAHRHINNNLG